MGNTLYLDDKYVSSISDDRTYISLLSHLKSSNYIYKYKTNEFQTSIKNNYVQIVVETEEADVFTNMFYAEFDYDGKTYSMIKQHINPKVARFYMNIDGDEIKLDETTIRIIFL